MSRMLGAFVPSVVGIVAAITLTASAPTPDPPPPPTAEGYVASTQPISQILAAGEWSYDAPPITVEAPPPVAVRHVYVPGPAPEPRADLGAVYAAGASMVGTPYVAGGSDPGGFDCSGFVAWAYAQAGVWLPRTTSGIRGRLTVISKADARPGDILYWPGHIALYAGPGLRLDANVTGSTVQVRSIYGSPLYLRMG